jgi:hypothetical protein
VIIGTMWLDLYAVYTAMPTSRGLDPLSREREVLDLAVVVCIGVAFSSTEQDRAGTRQSMARCVLAAALGRSLAFWRSGGGDEPYQEFVGAGEAGCWPGGHHCSDGAV